MRIRIASVFVDDQDRAAQFYTDVLGFVKKLDIPVGQFKFLTVASAEDSHGTQILLEPNDNPLASTFQKGVYASGMPDIVLSADDIQVEFIRLQAWLEATADARPGGRYRLVVADPSGGRHAPAARTAK